MVKTKNRISELDALRGIAALYVMFYHFTYRYVDIFGGEYDFPNFLKHGYLGVNVFFVISGFVIHLTLEKKKTLFDFSATRFARLYPVYWVAIAITFIVTTLFLHERSVQPEHALFNLTMLQTYLRVPLVDGVYWTLAFELSFYFWAAILYYSGATRYKKTLFLLVVAGIVSIKLLEAKTALVIPYNVHAIILIRYLHLFLLGVLLYKVYSGTSLLKALPYLATCLALSYWKSPVEFYAISITTVLFLMSFRGWAGFLGHPVLVYFGAISYSLYLIHQNLGFAIIKNLPVEDYWLRVGMASFVAVLVATPMTYLVERPAQRWIVNFWKQKRNIFFKESP